MDKSIEWKWEGKFRKSPEDEIKEVENKTRLVCQKRLQG